MMSFCKENDWALLPVDQDVTLFERPSEADVATPLLNGEVPAIFSLPDEPEPLVWSGSTFSDTYGKPVPTFNGRPIMLPKRAAARLKKNGFDVGLNDAHDPFLQYIYLNVVKNSGGDHNTSADDAWYRRHLHRSKRLVSETRGTVLDIGCDDPFLSRSLFPNTAKYIGLDPGTNQTSETSLIGMAEFLPFTDNSLDAVSFLTSLDHIMDYHTAILEAYRVLRPGGVLYLASLIWTDRAELVRDNIHFHHFRQFEIMGVLKPFMITQITRYDWKNESHRFGIYLAATKP